MPIILSSSRSKISSSWWWLPKTCTALVSFHYLRPESPQKCPKQSLLLGRFIRFLWGLLFCAATQLFLCAPFTFILSLKAPQTKDVRDILACFFSAGTDICWYQQGWNWAERNGNSIDIMWNGYFTMRKLTWNWKQQLLSVNMLGLGDFILNRNSGRPKY